MAQPRGPLAGVKVVACSTAQAGTVPYMLMADLGAEVIKIEVPGVGDGSRRAGRMPGFPSTYFETNNRGVQSLTLNLKAAESSATAAEKSALQLELGRRHREAKQYSEAAEWFAKAAQESDQSELRRHASQKAGAMKTHAESQRANHAPK